ncbi:hypothetical protein ACFOSW_02050 [Paenibacillus sp. GCM10012303]
MEETFELVKQTHKPALLLLVQVRGWHDCLAPLFLSKQAVLIRGGGIGQAA